MSDDDIKKIALELIDGNGVHKRTANKLDPEAKLSELSVSSRLFSEQLSSGYYDKLIGMGIASGLPAEHIAAKLGISTPDAKRLLAQYNTEQKKLREHNSAIRENLCDIITPRLAKLAVECTEQLIEKVSSGEMRTSDIAKTLDMAVKAIGGIGKPSVGSNDGVSGNGDNVSGYTDEELDDLLAGK